MFGKYYRLTKPGLVYGNVFTAIAGYLFASRWQIAWVPFCATICGLALVIAAACVFNNYLDRDIDAKMERTKNRALVTGAISPSSALAYGTLLVLVGLALLFLFVNSLTALATLAGFVWYVVLYGWSKRVSRWGAVVGSVAGAVPITAGYTAAAGRLDLAALILFLALAFWQIPHFYSIAMYRRDDYAAAGMPTFPSERGARAATWHMLLFVVAFTAAAYSLAMIGKVGHVYALVVMLAGAIWLAIVLRGFSAQDEKRWARRVFFHSLAVLFAFSVVLAASPLLP